MTRSNSPGGPGKPAPAAGILLLILLTADFMIFAALVGAEIVLREGVGSWVPGPLDLVLRDLMPLTAITAGALLLGFFAAERKAMLLPCFGVTLGGIVFEALKAFDFKGSYAGFFLVVSAYVALHLAGALLWVARSPRFEPGPLFRPFWFFTVAIGEAALLIVHWPLYS